VNALQGAVTVITQVIPSTGGPQPAAAALGIGGLGALGLLLRRLARRWRR
jgi:hypothetical protein